MVSLPQLEGNHFLMKRPKTYQDILVLYPHRRCAWEKDATTGRVVVHRPKFTSEIGIRLSRWFLKSRLLSIKLDAIGSDCWQLCDGKNDLHSIVNQMHSIHGVAVDPVVERVVQFLIHLEKNDFLTFLNAPLSVNKDQTGFSM